MKKKGMICVSCGALAHEAKLRFQGYDVDGWRCECGEEYFHPGQAQEILSLNRIMKKKYKVKIGQMRSNLIIRLPTELASALDLHKGEEVVLQADGHRKFHVDGKS